MSTLAAVALTVLVVPDSIGVFRRGTFYLDQGAPGSQSEKPFYMGSSAARPMAGDWNGDRVGQLGVFQDGLMFLAGSAPFRFGRPSDVPIAGDWDGDGKDQVGVFRDSGGVPRFFLDMGAQGYQGAHRFERDGIPFGLAGDLPVAGDFDGDGKDQVGVFRSGQFFFDLGEPGYQGEQPIFFGLHGDKPVVGDWEGVSVDRAGVFRDGNFYRDVGPAGYQNERPLAFGQRGDLPISGLWGKLALGRKAYDYVPAVVHNGSVFRAWWCGLGTNPVAGDHIYYAQSAQLDGPWTDPRAVFKMTGSRAHFDGRDVCDPTVIKHGTKFYMYYGGHPRTDSQLPQTTMVGVARSLDSHSWSRPSELQGRPMIRPNRDPDTLPNKYGAGQPSSFVIGDYIYVIYTDSTGLDGNPVNGAGVYVIRSKDPLFRSGVQELTQTGFVHRGTTAQLRTTYKLLEAFSVDAMYEPTRRQICIAVHGVFDQTEIYFFDLDFRRLRHEVIPFVPWTEGPGLVRKWQGTARAPEGNRLRVELMYSTGCLRWPEQGFEATWDLGFSSEYVAYPTSP